MPLLKKIPVWIFFLVLFLFIPGSPAHAEISSCVGSIDPASVLSGSTSDITFTLTNNSDRDIPATWVRITRPSAIFTINSSSASGWSSTSSPSSTTLTGGTLNAYDSIDITLSITAVDQEYTPQGWGVEMSDDPDASSTGCGGTMETGIVYEQHVGVTISDTTISSISDTSATITWTTNLATDANLLYGLTEEYGSTALVETLTTSHSITLTSLTANTTYHVFFSSTNEEGYSADSGDFTFTTAATSTTTTVTVTVVITPTPTGRPAPTPTPIPDTSPPVIKLSTDLKKPFYPAPKISGTATDNKAVSKIFYSLDSGQTWITIDDITGISTTKANFSFTPKGLEDGSYPMQVKATDSSDNSNTPATTNLVIDRLPPLVGMGMVSVGPQILSSNSQGQILTLAGIPNKIVVTASGGPTSISMISDNNILAQLEKQLKTDLWIGSITSEEPGTYPIHVDSLDGAKNRTSRQLFTITALPKGKITGPSKATVRVFVFDNAMQKFILWDGAPYEFSNPQTTDSLGNYQLILPPGKYYLEVSAPFYKTNRSTIFDVKYSFPVNPEFRLNPVRQIKLGQFVFPLPDFSVDSTEFIISPPGSSPTQNPSQGKPLPAFNYQNGPNILPSSELIGKPQIITLLSTWSPNTVDQIRYLNNFTLSSQIPASVIVPNESASSVFLFHRRGNYILPIYSDPDGNLITPLSIFSSPTHLFLNSAGIVEKIIVGLLTPENLLHNITN